MKIKLLMILTLAICVCFFASCQKQSEEPIDDQPSETTSLEASSSEVPSSEMPSSEAPSSEESEQEPLLVFDTPDEMVAYLQGKGITLKREKLLFERYDEVIGNRIYADKERGIKAIDEFKTYFLTVPMRASAIDESFMQHMAETDPYYDPDYYPGFPEQYVEYMLNMYYVYSSPTKEYGDSMEDLYDLFPDVEDHEWEGNLSPDFSEIMSYDLDKVRNLIGTENDAVEPTYFEYEDIKLYAMYSPSDYDELLSLFVYNAKDELIAVYYEGYSLEDD